MAIGTAAAIGLGLAGVGAVASSRSASSASRRAAETSTSNTAANNALALNIYGQNQQALSPFMNSGNVAGNQINALLGLGGAPQQQVQPNALTQFTGNAPYGGAGMPYGLGDAYVPQGTFGGFNPPGYGDATGNLGFDGRPDQVATGGGVMPTGGALGGGTGGTMPQGQTAQQAANDAFDIFRNSTGYEFRRGEGLDAVNSGYAGAGILQSGAAMRGITEYGQNFASNEFGNYMNALGTQQAVGAGAASSLAGVGQNYASQVINSNNANAANQMNAQLARGNNNALGNVAGMIGGGLFQYGIGG